MPEIVKREDVSAQLMESVLLQGDLSKLSPADRVSYYRMVCESLNLNPLTRPFEYITLNGKLTLYAKKDCTDQLRQIRGISIRIVNREEIEGVYTVTARATAPDGREDEDCGAVTIGKGEARAIALMKATTKAKRRVTLSICGLAMVDESEVEVDADHPISVKARANAKRAEAEQYVETKRQVAAKVAETPPDEPPEQIASVTKKAPMPGWKLDIVRKLQELKAELGAVEYYAILEKHKVKKSTDIADRQTGQTILRDMANRLNDIKLELQDQDVEGLLGKSLERFVDELPEITPETPSSARVWLKTADGPIAYHVNSDCTAWSKA